MAIHSGPKLVAMHVWVDLVDPFAEALFTNPNVHTVNVRIVCRQTLGRKPPPRGTEHHFAVPHLALRL